MKRALVFSGQGSHRKGMSMNLINTPPVAALWSRMQDCMMQNYGVSLQDITTENPTETQVRSTALDLQSLSSISCKETVNNSESTERSKIIRHPQGVMSYSYFTQPCVVAAHMIAYEKLKTDKKELNLGGSHMISGHSLGEFSALCALGVFSPECALNLTYKRGLLMEQSLEGHDRSRYRMYACNPTRARLHDNSETADDMFFILIELVSRAFSATTSFVEVSNYNLRYQQYVLAGDVVALSVVGKCLDPQFRANCAANSLEALVKEACTSVNLDKKDGVTVNPNRGPSPDFVTGSAKKYGARATFRRFMRGPDDGFTPALDELTHLTLQEDGRSGLKKKSWFIPLSVEVPFHTSGLRKCTDLLLPIVEDALPDEATLRNLLSVEGSESNTQYEKHPLWVTNLTGTIFKPFDATFQNDCISMITSQNVGERQHKGRYSSTIVLENFNKGVQEKSVRKVCASVLAAQLSHPVLWIDVMDEMIIKGGCREVYEIAPTRNVSEMFKRATFISENSEPKPIELITKCYPADSNLF